MIGYRVDRSTALSVTPFRRRVQENRPISALSPESPTLGRFWGRLGEEGGSLPIGEARVSLASKGFLGSNHDLREWAQPCPLTLALSPNTRNGDRSPKLEEREEIV